MSAEEKLKEAAGNYQKNKAFFKKLKQKRKSELDNKIHELHEAVFEKTDCLSCANCCKTTGPLLIDKDIDRISRNLKLRPSAFIEQYLRVDEDGDYVFKEMPCPFLGSDNLCSIYDIRPRACRQYPHTNRKNMRQILNLTLKNTMVCPAVYEIFKKLQEETGW